jgi:hypothetical protein
MQVTSTINSTDAQNVNYRNEPTASIRAFQNIVLSELPGAAFAILTLFWVVSSLIRL